MADHHCRYILVEVVWDGHHNRPRLPNKTLGLNMQLLSMQLPYSMPGPLSQQSQTTEEGEGYSLSIPASPLGQQLSYDYQSRTNHTVSTTLIDSTLSKSNSVTHKNTVSHDPSSVSFSNTYQNLNFNYIRNKLKYKNRNARKAAHRPTIKENQKMLNKNKYITNLSSKSLSPPQVDVLSLGLTFVPSRNPPLIPMSESLDNFDRSNRLKFFFSNTPKIEPHPLKKKSSWNPPRASPDIENYLKRIRNEITSLHSLKTTPNLTPTQNKALRELQSEQNTGHQKCRQRLRHCLVMVINCIIIISNFVIRKIRVTMWEN